MIAILFKGTGLCRQINHTAITTFVLLIVCSGFSFCAERYEVDETAEFRNIVAALQNEQYTEGYASFWRANIVTELSNGSIDMRDWQDSGGEQHITVASIDDTYKWLQLVSHDYTRPEEKYSFSLREMSGKIIHGQESSVQNILSISPMATW